jgi:hypothetical protein
MAAQHEGPAAEVSAQAAFPAYPPGLHRRIVLQPGDGWIGAALEDDMHRFHLRLDHAQGRVTAVAGKAVRHPWSACPGAIGFMAAELTGQLLADVARRDPFQHCTHLFDLAVLVAAHTEDREPTRFDMTVADRVEERTTATLYENGVEKLRWRLSGTTIAGDAPFGGRDLRQLSKWKQALPAADGERATLLRRAIFVSGARQYAPPPGDPSAYDNRERMGVCFNYQLPQAATSHRTPDWHRDFSQSGAEPLQGLDPAREFEAMGAE